MRWIRIFLAFPVYSNLWIAGIAFLLTQETFLYILNRPLSSDYAGFVVFATLCSYSFHWFLTDHSVIPSPRIQWLKKYKWIHAVLFVAGVAGASLFFFRLDHKLWLLSSAGIAFLYSAPKIPHPLFRALRKAAIGKTIFLAFAWMFVTSFLPVEIADTPWSAPLVLFCIYRFFMIYAICILFDYRDRADDKADGIRSLITYLSESGVHRLFVGSVFTTAVTGLSLWYWDYPVWQCLILISPALSTALLYRRAKKDFSDLFYYCLLDGLMALPALLMLFTRI